MLSPLRALALAAAVALTAAPALADCYINGQQVPEGTKVGGLTCTNGQWVAG
jgi:hypothetical protein